MTDENERSGGRGLRRFGRLVLLAMGSALVVCLGAAFVVRYLAIREARIDFPPPGRLVQFDGALSHLHCLGSGTPTIVLEAGLDDLGSWVLGSRPRIPLRDLPSLRLRSWLGSCGASRERNPAMESESLKSYALSWTRPRSRVPT